MSETNLPSGSEKKMFLGEGGQGIAHPCSILRTVLICLGSSTGRPIPYTCAVMWGPGATAIALRGWEEGRGQDLCYSLAAGLPRSPSDPERCV